MSRRLTPKEHYDLATKLFEEKPDMSLSSKLRIIANIAMYHHYDNKHIKLSRKLNRKANMLNAHFKTPEMRKHLPKL